MPILLSNLAAKQKRLLDWHEFLNSAGSTDVGLRAEGEKALVQFRTLLAQAWRNGGISAELEQQIRSTEQALESLSEEVRLRIGGSTPIKKEKTFLR